MTLWEDSLLTMNEYAEGRRGAILAFDLELVLLGSCVSARCVEEDCLSLAQARDASSLVGNRTLAERSVEAFELFRAQQCAFGRYRAVVATYQSEPRRHDQKRSIRRARRAEYERAVDP